MFDCLNLSFCYSVLLSGSNEIKSLNPILCGGCSKTPKGKMSIIHFKSSFWGFKRQWLFNIRCAWPFRTIFCKLFLLGNPPGPTKSLKFTFSIHKIIWRVQNQNTPSGPPKNPTRFWKISKFQCILRYFIKVGFLRD